MKNNIEQSIIVWNNRFPLDRWWRKKYNTPYLSPEHRKSTFFGQYYEYYEDRLFKDYYAEKEKEGGVVSSKYVPISGNWWKGKVLPKKEIDDWFNTPIS